MQPVVLKYEDLHELHNQLAVMFKSASDKSDSDQANLLRVMGRVKTEIDLKVNFCVTVDEWPHFTTVLVGGNDCIIRREHDRYNIFTKDINKALQLLHSEGIINKTPTFIIESMTPSCKDLMDSCKTKWRYASVRMSMTGNGLVCQRSVPLLPSLPEGLQHGGLFQADAPTINDNLPYRTDDTLQYVQFLIEKFPNLCLRTVDSGQLVGYCLQKIDHSAGMLFVDPQFRGRGIAKYLTSHFAKLISDKGDIFFAFSSSPESIHVHQTCGCLLDSEVYAARFFKDSQTESMYYK